jgi:hypothetical protein
LLDIVGEGAFHQVYRGMYINIINTIPYDKVILLDIIGEGAFHQVNRGMNINIINTIPYDKVTVYYIYIQTSIYLMKGIFTFLYV